MGSNGLCVADKSTDELLHDFQNGGEAAAFEEIVRRYAGMVYTVCLGVTRDVHDAEDATQAAFLTLALRAKTAENIKYLGPWMQKVARRLSLDIMRAKKRRKRREEVRGVIVRQTQPNRDPRIGLDREEMSDIVRDELGKLPAKYRLPLILHYFGGMRPDQVARELGYKPSTLGVRLHRGRKMLADSLAQRGITISSAMLATILAAVEHQGISDNVVAQASLVAAGVTCNGELPAAIISARVLALTRHAASAVVWAKAKTVIATLLMATAALAGGAQIARTIAPYEIDLRLLNPLHWIRPLLRSFTASPQVVAADSIKTTVGSIQDRDRVPAWLNIRLDDPAVEVSSLTGTESDMMERSGIATVEFLSLYPTDDPPLFSVSAGSASMSMAQAGWLNAPSLASISAPSIPAGLASPGSVAPGFVADTTTRSIRHVSGTRRWDRLVLDSANSDFQQYLLGGSARLFSNNLVIGDAGVGSLRQTGGQVGISGDLVLGERGGGAGGYRLEAGQLHATNAYIGRAGAGRFVQTGGANFMPQLHLGHDRGSRGLYAMRGGSLQSNQINVGVSGEGEFEQSGGESTVGSGAAAGVITLGVNEHGAGSYVMTGGTLRADAMIVGASGAGVFDQSGGSTSVRDVQVGLYSSGAGTLVVRGGEFQLQPAGQIVVGSGGTGTVVVGNNTGGAIIREEPPESGVPLTVRAQPGARGTFRGIGDVRLTGRIEQNWRVIGDGFGKPLELDFSTASQVTNTIDNPPGGDNGWFAHNGGRLVLPPIDIPSDLTATWGEDPHDPVPDLINSVRFTVHEVAHPGKAIISLISPDNALLPQLPTGEQFIGLWGFDRRELEFGNSYLVLRYDDCLVGALGGDEDELRLWTFDREWEMLPPEWIVRDASLNLLAAHFDGQFRLFGISLARESLTPDASRLELPQQFAAIPEPTGFCSVVVAGAAVLLRRRRR